jgi:hypothetical protein
MVLYTSLTYSFLKIFLSWKSENNYPIISDTVGEYTLERTFLQIYVHMSENVEIKGN